MKVILNPCNVAVGPILVGNMVYKSDPEKVYDAVPSKDGKSYTIRIEGKRVS